MSDAFDDPAGRAPPPVAPWLGPPSGTLPGIVPLEIVLAVSNTAAVCVSRLAAYRTGFELDVVTVAHPDADALDPGLFGPLRGRHGSRAGRLRIAVEFADGATATNAGGGGGEAGRPPAGPVLRAGDGGGGGGGQWRQRYWVWPLPPAGPLALVCEWPAAAIPVTRQELEASIVLDAARRAIVLFEDGAAGSADARAPGEGSGG